MSRRVQLSMIDFASSKRKNTSTGNEPPSKKVSPDADNLSLKSPRPGASGKWTSVGSSLLIYTTNDVKPSDQIASFDMDGTLIKTKSGAVFPKNSGDWQLWNSKVVSKLQQLHNDGYKIVIFTNQRGIEQGKVLVSDFKNKIVSVCKALRVPVQAFISTGHVSYRKPYIGMWVEMENNYNDGVEVDRSASIYCGDAAGREKNNIRKADHSCADRLFAQNLGVPFKTPEQLFLGQAREEPYRLTCFNSADYLAEPKERFSPAGTKFPYDSEIQEIIIMVGSPASGKSFIAKHLAEDYGYEIVNQDTLGSKAACDKLTVELLKQGNNVIVDNTNRDPITRMSYIKAAKARNCRIRAIVMNCEKAMAQHNNVFRQIVKLANNKQTSISTMVFNSFYSQLREPTQDEGFDDIIHANFVPEFADEKAREIYSLFLTEK
ncbi:putative protein F21D5.5 [Aphelenchoides bicaudatus]|nr:putative protein F21D5.5 [Aphelenchoides bicaudatus]